ncbi:hypothetical protein [Sorangium cellulosum]|uniref:hypothetical protein n=1 Tax=Sorangium cellulosum TaxID=56 RepID=UPI0002FC364F|nr:hypothetical protein [Sorangium cellulosum]
MLRRAHARLALLTGFGDEPHLLPGKLYDYLLARARPGIRSSSPTTKRSPA